MVGAFVWETLEAWPVARGQNVRASMSRCCPPVASVVRGLLGSVFFCLTRTMSLRGNPAAYLSGAASTSSSRAGCDEGGSGGSAFFLPSTSSQRPRLLRLPEVPGDEPFKANDALLHLPLSAPATGQAQHHVVYFPGDVQVGGGRRRSPRSASFLRIRQEGNAALHATRGAGWGGGGTAWSCPRWDSFVAQPHVRTQTAGSVNREWTPQSPIGWAAVAAAGAEQRCGGVRQPKKWPMGVAFGVQGVEGFSLGLLF